MNINSILFSLLAMPAENYLSNESWHYKRFKRKLKLKNPSFKKNLIKRTSIDSILNKAVKKSRKSGNLEEPLITNKNNISEIFNYSAEFFSEFRTSVKSLYGSLIKYTKSKYKSEKSNKNISKNCWQIGIDISSTCNFIFYPKKEKKVTGQLIDMGILFDYINPAPALCYF